MSLETFFWISLLLGLYPYFLYPIVAWALAAILRTTVRTAPYAPKVSILISAFNEAKYIEATVRDKLAQQYAGKIEILVASDESTDGTDEIVERIAQEDYRVKLYRQVPRAGKTSALNNLVPRATGSILVLSDANSLYAPDTVTNLVSRFADNTVGYVTGKMVYVNEDGSLVGDGCSAYMKYENMLRDIETRLGSVVGVDGGVDAVRTRLYQSMRADQLPDFVLPLSVVAQGYRVVYAEDALLKEETLTTQASEYRMRVRVSLRAMWALKDNWRLLFCSAGTLFAWQLWSHKALRYLSFLPLAIAFITSAILAAQGSILYVVLFAGYVGALLAAFLGAKGSRISLCRYAYYFALLNWACVVAAGRFVRGKKQILWQPRGG